MDQQSALAWELADDLGGPGWSALTLPVNGTPQPFRYRESEYGWVLAGDAPGVHLGAYGRGVSAYGLGLHHGDGLRPRTGPDPTVHGPDPTAHAA